MRLFFFAQLILVLVTAFFSGCSTLVDDIHPPAIESNYLNLEIYGRENLYNGIAIFELDKIEEISSLNLKVKGYYTGELAIKSEFCKINEIRHYKEHELINLNFNEVKEKFCIIDLVLNIDYKEQQNGVKTFPMKGSIIIVPIKKDYTVNSAVKYRHGELNSLSFSHKLGDNGYDGMISGCGVKEFFKSKLIGEYTHHTHDYLFPVKNCVVNIGLKSLVNKLRIRIYYNIYKNDYHLMTIPSVSFDGDSLHIESSSDVSIISVGDSFKFTNSQKFEFKEKDIVRIITASGRLLLGEIKNGVILWRP